MTKPANELKRKKIPVMPELDPHLLARWIEFFTNIKIVIEKPTYGGPVIDPDTLVARPKLISRGKIVNYVLQPRQAKVVGYMLAIGKGRGVDVRAMLQNLSVEDPKIAGIFKDNKEFKNKFLHDLGGGYWRCSLPKKPPKECLLDSALVMPLPVKPPKERLQDGAMVKPLSKHQNGEVGK